MVHTVFRVISVRKNTREKNSLPLSIEYWENKACSTQYSRPGKEQPVCQQSLGEITWRECQFTATWSPAEGVYWAPIQMLRNLGNREQKDYFIFKSLYTDNPALQINSRLLHKQDYSTKKIVSIKCYSICGNRPEYNLNLNKLILNYHHCIKAIKHFQTFCL